nr:MAG TPA: hypothetical protein [Caudoviricetes sp.]
MSFHTATSNPFLRRLFGAEKQIFVQPSPLVAFVIEIA